MSTIVAVNYGGQVVLATDSRETSVAGTVSDTMQKIFELVPGVFFATAGTTGLMTEQVSIATQLAKTADLTNPRGFADALDRASQQAFDRKLARTMELRSKFHFLEEEATGERPLHTYVVAFTSNGSPGFICREFTLENGKVVMSEHFCFDIPAGYISRITVGGPLIRHLTGDPRLWEYGLIKGVDRLLEGLRKANPYVGGPDQMVVLDWAGARWIRRLTNPQSTYTDVNHALNTRVDGTTMQVVGNQLVLGSVPLANLVNSVGALPSGWTYAGQVAVQQLVVGTGTAYFASTATFGSVNASGPCVQIGAAGAVFKDNLSSPANTMTCAPSGVNITGGGGITIQTSSTGLKLVLASSAIQFQSNTSVLMQMSGSAFTYYYPGSTNQSLVMSSAGSLTLYTPTGLAAISIGNTGAAVVCVANSLTTTINNATSAVLAQPCGLTVNDGFNTHGITATGHGSYTSGGVLSFLLQLYGSKYSQNMSTLQLGNFTAGATLEIVPVTATSANTTSGGPSLPALPAKFLECYYGGTQYKIPLFAA